jgi:hypothetical protein
MFEVIDPRNNESHGTYDTLAEALGCVEFDRLTTYSVWHNGERVAHRYESD